MKIDPKQLRISSQKDSFKGWGGVFIAIILTATLVTLLLFVFGRLGVGRVEWEGAAEVGKRLEEGPALFAPLLERAQESEKQ